MKLFTIVTQTNNFYLVHLVLHLKV